mgnify:CR=1 FL=1
MKKRGARIAAIVLLVCLLLGNVALAEPSWVKKYRGAVSGAFKNTSSNYYIGLMDIRGKGLPVLMLGHRSGSSYRVELYYIKTSGSLRKSSHNYVNAGLCNDIYSYKVVSSSGKYQVLVVCHGLSGSYEYTKIFRITQNSKRVLDVQELFRSDVYGGMATSSRSKYYASKKKVSYSTFQKKLSDYGSKYTSVRDAIRMEAVSSRTEALSLFESDAYRFW